MEEQQIPLTEEEFIARLMAQQEEANRAAKEAAAKTAAAPGSVRKTPTRKSSPYRYWALLLAGILCYALFIGGATLVWGSLVFMNQGDVDEATIIPRAIFLGAAFFSCAIVTLLSRGGTIFPALGLAVIINILPFVLPGAPITQPRAVAIMLGCTLLVAIAGFILSKLLYIKIKKV